MTKKQASMPPEFTVIGDVLDEFVLKAREKYDTDAFACGYLQSLVRRLLLDCLPGQQEIILDQLKNSSAFK